MGFRTIAEIPFLNIADAKIIKAKEYNSSILFSKKGFSITKTHKGISKTLISSKYRQILEDVVIFLSLLRSLIYSPWQSLTEHIIYASIIPSICVYYVIQAL